MTANDNLISGSLSLEIHNRFKRWMTEAEAKEPNDPNALALATVSAHGQPSVRMVLLKEYDQNGFVFYTNLTSRKGQDISQNNKASMLFHWKSLKRQIRVEGFLQPVTSEEADRYYHSRARGSRIGAWASDQSAKLEKRSDLDDKVADLTARYKDSEIIPRPPFWSGFRLVAHAIEFWKDRDSRLHERDFYQFDPQKKLWHMHHLYP